MLHFYAIPKHEVNEAKLTKELTNLKSNPTEVLDYLMSHPCDDIAVYLDRIAEVSTSRKTFNDNIYHIMIAVITLKHFETGFELSHSLGDGLI